MVYVHLERMMGKRVLLFLGWFIVVAGLNHEVGIMGQPYERFDYMRLSQWWPGSQCQLTSCKGTPLPYFTIHGLWPDNYEGPGLFECYDVPYVTINDKNMLEKLNAVWVNVQTKKNNKLWKHEWETHGTCALSLYNQDQYFSKALALKGKYDLLAQLEKDKITPSNTISYNADNIRSSIKKLTGKTPDIECRTKNNKQLVYEVRICYDPTGANTVDCPSNRGTPQCSGDAYLPPASSTSLHVSA